MMIDATFVRLTGVQTREISLIGNQLRAAQRPVARLIASAPRVDGRGGS